MGCLDDGSRSSQPNATSANAAQAVQDKMEIVAGLSTNEEISGREVARGTGIPYITAWVALRCAL